MSSVLPLAVDRPGTAAERCLRGMERLVKAVQELSPARDLAAIQRIVCTTARALTGADGATFVLREAGMCHYADEDAIAPLWKGRRFPVESCISGWVMLNRKSTLIPDVYADPRIPVDAYRPTFVKSLAMVPIRALDPIGAIGNYWGRHYTPDEREVALLQALADTTAVAMENARVYSELEQRVRDRTADLRQANAEIRRISLADEFCVLALDHKSEDDTLRRRLAESLARFSVGRPYTLSASVGIAAPADGDESLDALLTRADASMDFEKRAKKKGRAWAPVLAR